MIVISEEKRGPKRRTVAFEKHVWRVHVDRRAPHELDPEAVVIALPCLDPGTFIILTSCRTPGRSTSDNALCVGEL